MHDVFSPSSESVAPRSTGLAASVQEGMTTEPTMFIGAVTDEWELYSDRAEDYTIGSPIGFGASSIVYAATYRPPTLSSSPSNHRTSTRGIPCALKVLDLDSLPPRALHLLQRETTLMSLSKHPNVLRVRGSWITGHKLYIALRLMKKGSAADVMRYGWPGGMEEDVVRCILRQALKGLNYLHTNGFIHRDIKAANLLIDDDGTVLLGDLGVAADLAEDTSHVPSSSTSTNMYSLAASTTFAQSLSAPTLSVNTTKRAVGQDKTPKPRIGKRKSFVGTPCWMSPELIQGKQYDSKADIWSFGITALELTQGRPPRSRESPQRVLLRTLQEDPPTLNRDGGIHKYSRAFKEMIDSCLAKDPAKRPTAEELLQTPFFKAAKKKSYLINTILIAEGLPPLTQRQERRVVQPLLSANSIDSWDFGLTLNSPTTSISRRSVLEKYVSAEDQEDLQAHGIPIKSNPDDYRSKFNHHPSQLSAVPHEPPVLDDFSDTDDYTNDQEFRSSSSQSSILSSDIPLSQTSSPPDTSAPSSYASSSNLAQRLQAAEKKSDALAGSGRDSLISIAENHDHTLIGMKSIIGGRSTATPNNGKSNGSETPTLWSRLKSNVKRPTSSKGHDPEMFDGSPRGKEKEKEKAKISMASPKSLLSRSSTRSLARMRKEGK